LLERRRCHHLGRVLTDEAMAYIRSLVDEITARVIQTVRGTKIDMTNYREMLIRRYWVYQREFFPDAANHFDHPESLDLPPRPPVFLKSREWENVIIKPGATREETSQLLALIPEGEKHRWFRSMNSSQALSQSVLGNLALSGDLGSLAQLADDDGLALFGKAQVSAGNFSMEFKLRYLGEPVPTSLDAYIGGGYRVAIECKFSESDVGTCSRPRLTSAHANHDRDFCDRSYTRQGTRRERCSLTEIGVLYWRYVQQLFRWKSEQDLPSCPLYANYQLVRNILAIGVTPDGRVSPTNGHVVMVYDERNPVFQVNGRGFSAFAETRGALREPTMLRKCSWQKIVQHLRSADILPWLTDHLACKYGL
jgi:hypothetical protein